MVGLWCVDFFFIENAEGNPERFWGECGLGPQGAHKQAIAKEGTLLKITLKMHEIYVNFKKPMEQV